MAAAIRINANDWDDVLKTQSVFNSKAYTHDAPAEYSDLVDEVVAGEDKKKTADLASFKQKAEEGQKKVQEEVDKKRNEVKEQVQKNVTNTIKNATEVADKNKTLAEVTA